MHIEALAAVASVLSVVVIGRMVMNQLKAIVKKEREQDRARFVHDGMNADLDSIITVTRKGTNDSVQLPAHYDRKAVSKFLEMTA